MNQQTFSKISAQIHFQYKITLEVLLVHLHFSRYIFNESNSREYWLRMRAWVQQEKKDEKKDEKKHWRAFRVRASGFRV
jgi:hypothetical protein